MEHDKTRAISTLRNKYDAAARLIALKKSLLSPQKKVTQSERNWYFTTLFLTVALLAGALTGFGAAAPIISAILSLFTMVSVQTGYLALMIFGVYSIPWAIVYIPEVGNLFRNYWENYFQPISKDETPLFYGPALEQAHQILEMQFRKSINNILKEKAVSKDEISLLTNKTEHEHIIHTGIILKKLALYNALEHAMKQDLTSTGVNNDASTLISRIINYAIESDYAKLGCKLSNIEKISTASLIKQTAQITPLNEGEKNTLRDFYSNLLAEIILNDGSNISRTPVELTRRQNSLVEEKTTLSIHDFIQFNALEFQRLEKLTELKETKQTDTFLKTTDKLESQWLWRILKLHSKPKSKWIKIAESIGFFLGFFNAAIANTTGTALAPLYIIATIMMIYGMPNALMPLPLSLILVGMFAASGFIASFGITRKSIERVFSDIANFFLDSDRAQRKHKQWIKPMTLLYGGMALLLAVSIASFNFLAGVTFGHILLNPMLLTQPTYIASYSISSFALLHPLEIALGAIGFGFTVIAVAPLMLGAWNAFLKANTTEPFWQKPLISTVAFLTSSINTVLLVRMLLRPGSPLTLFFGQAPWVISAMTVLAPICIFILGFALFYMGMKTLLSTRGRDCERIYDETFALDPKFLITHKEFHSYDQAYSCNPADQKTSSDNQLMSPSPEI